MPQNIDWSATRPAGFWVRVLAYAIDFLILLTLIVLQMFAKSVEVYLLILVPLIAYKPVLEGMFGGTAGKLAIGLRVVNEQGQRIGIAGGFVRSGLLLLPLIPGALIQTELIQLGISPFDVATMEQFQKDSQMLYTIYYIFAAISFVSCVVVAFHPRKRGLHDILGSCYVIYDKKSAPET